MLKNIFVLLFIVLFMFTIFVTNEFSKDNQYISTFKSHVLPQFKISNRQIMDYYSEDKNLREEASKSIILTTLKNLGYNQWIEYADYISLMVYQSNIMPGDDNELIVALNLSKDTAVIGIYKLVNDEYIFVNKIENILPTNKIEFIKIPGLSYNFLITDQLLDERLGAFFLEQFLEIFQYQDESFKSVWRKTKYSKEIYNASWLDPKAPSNEWFQIIENNTINFREEPNLNISVNIHRQKLKATKDTFPFDNDFKPLEDMRKMEHYYWSPKYQTFIMGEGKLRFSEISIGIIDDTKNWTEFSLGLTSNNYKIITTIGEILYIKKEGIIQYP